VRRDVTAKASFGDRVRKCLIHALHRLAIPFDCEPLPAPLPPAQVR
jgi:hypothetical protein